MRLSRPRMLGWLRELAAIEGTGVSAFIRAGTSPDQVHELLRSVLPDSAIPADMVELTAGSATGAAVYWGPSQKLLIRPPFPLQETFIAPGCDVEPLRSLLERPSMIALILVRLGAFAVGVWQGEKLVASKTGTGLVHGRHRKGGSSQRRFERHREKQIEYFIGRVCGHVRQNLEPHAAAIDYLVYGGSWTTIATLRQGCPFLRRFEDRTLPPLLSIPRPRPAVLEAAIGEVLSSNVTEWRVDLPAEIDTSITEA